MLTSNSILEFFLSMNPQFKWHFILYEIIFMSNGGQDVQISTVLT